MKHKNPVGETLHEVHLHVLAAGGEAVGRLADGRVVFVPLGAANEEATLRLTEESARFARGEIVEIARAASTRVAPPCPYYPQVGASEAGCGGCQLQHIEAEAQREAKRGFLVEALRRIGRFGPEIEAAVAPCVTLPQAFFYRNKAEFAVASTRDAVAVTQISARDADQKKDAVASTRDGAAGLENAHFPAADEAEAASRASARRGDTTQRRALPFASTREENAALIGFRARNSHRIIDVARCLIQDELVNQVLTATRAALHEGFATPQILQRVVVRVAAGEALVVVETSRAAWPQERDFATYLRRAVPQIVGVMRRIPGQAARLIEDGETSRGWLEENVEGLRLRVTADGFFQVNAAGAALLVQHVLRMAQVKNGTRVLDVYCGVGLFALAMARAGADVTGIESGHQAVRDARRNAQLNGLRAAFFGDDAARALKHLAAQHAENGAAPVASSGAAKKAAGPERDAASTRDANENGEKSARPQKRDGANTREVKTHAQEPTPASTRNADSPRNAAATNAAAMSSPNTQVERVENASRETLLAPASTRDAVSAGAPHFEVIVLDPPRAGAAGCLPFLLQLRPARLVYVSCDAATFSRDARVLAAAGYALREAVPVDMFPQTAHIECVALFTAINDLK